MRSGATPVLELSESLSVPSRVRAGAGEFPSEVKMRSAKSTGRLIGMLLLIQLAGLIVPFVLLLPLTTGPENYLRS